MICPRSIAAVALATIFLTAAAWAHDETKYPDWSGQWLRAGGIQWDPTKPIGRGQQAPLTPEYQAIFEASLADQAAGGPGNDARYSCFPVGMPRLMSVIFPMEFIFSPRITYILFENNMPRRIYYDGRAWPDHPEPTFAGYSIGQWIDADGDGRYDALEVETRHMKGPRTLEGSGLPLHKDNQTMVKERIFLDRRTGYPARRNHHHRSRADAALDQLPKNSAVSAIRRGSRTIARRTITTWRSARRTIFSVPTAI